jgi:hypothetical protein
LTVPRASFARPLAWLALALSVSSCTLALGIDTDAYVTASDRLCACDGIEAVFSDCSTRVRESLDGADDQERRSWLDLYEAQDCGACGDGLVYCLQEAPVCRGQGESCSRLLDCCGLIEDGKACVGGHCDACVPTGGACSSSGECCDVLTGTTYCFDGTCRAEPPSCKHTNEKCTKTEDCCGSEIGKGFCIVGTCIELCADPVAAQNCPGCCGHGGDTGQDPICVDGPAVAAQAQMILGVGADVCELTCWLGVDEACPSGTVCQKLASGDSGGIQLCLPPP